MLSRRTSPPDPLALALERKSHTGAPGTALAHQLAAGEGWSAEDIVCTSGPADRPFEERYGSTSIALVMSGTFLHRSNHGNCLMSPGALLLGNAGDSYEVSHQHGEGDRCVAFHFEPGLLERVAHDAGRSRARFDRPRLPMLRPLAPLVSRVSLALERQDSFEEIALEAAASAIRLSGHEAADAPRSVSLHDTGRVARVLRHLEDTASEPHRLADLAQAAGLSRYHFLRTFKAVTGATPHQWLLRARLRDAARRLAMSKQPVTEIALDCGFDDLSNFIRTFRAEFGISPSRYRARA